MGQLQEGRTTAAEVQVAAACVACPPGCCGAAAAWHADGLRRMTTPAQGQRAGECCAAPAHGAAQEPGQLAGRELLLAVYELSSVGCQLRQRWAGHRLQSAAAPAPVHLRSGRAVCGPCTQACGPSPAPLLAARLQAGVRRSCCSCWSCRSPGQRDARPIARLPGSGVDLHSRLPVSSCCAVRCWRAPAVVGVAGPAAAPPRKKRGASSREPRSHGCTSTSTAVAVPVQTGAQIAQTENPQPDPRSAGRPGLRVIAPGMQDDCDVTPLP